MVDLILLLVWRSRFISLTLKTFSFCFKYKKLIIILKELTGQENGVRILGDVNWLVKNEMLV